MKSLLFAALAAAATAFALPVYAAPINLLAAESFYGEAARAIGANRVKVDSVIVAPGTDPHDFDPPPSVARLVADAKIVVMNGADYDHWMEHLVEANTVDGRVVIDVAALSGHKGGDNPHVWYDPAAMPAMANALTAELVKLDPLGKDGYEQRRDAFLATLKPIADKVAALKQKFAGTPVVATEPVFGYMAEALGLKMENQAFQTAIMNESEPAASEVAAMEDAIRSGTVKILFYNSQVEDAFTRNLAELAKSSGVPLVPVTETEPEGKTFAEWMLDTLDATAQALGHKSS
jgi:zinc/manganese transport system substrate-binding protein